ncbi:MAG: hypothetical protein IPP94_10610 [Ignavibacteria bacterium]|nr:hypothetical protein [Ignavibacteria bacterium]
MKAFFALSLAALLIAGCGKQQNAETQPGTAQSAYTDVIDSNRGYIIENAKFAAEGETAVFTIGDSFRLAAGTSSVLVLREKETEAAPGYILALQFPSFASNTSVEYGSDAATCQYWVVGLKDAKLSYVKTGLISGSLRFIKKAASTINLGLNRDIQDGVGDIEIALSNIAAPGVKVADSKKFAARFQLPLITLEEMAKIMQPA